jgi:hypothetical protein
MDYNTASMQDMPQDDTMMQLDLKRKLALADALRQQESPQGQMISGFYVAPSWTQSLAGIANKYVAGQQEKQALGQFGEYQKGKQDRITRLVNELSKGKTEPVDYNEAGNMPGMEQTTPFNQQEYMAKVLQTMPELAPKFLEANLTNQFKEETPVSLGEGGVLVNRRGEVIASNPKTPKFSDRFSNIKVDENTGKTYGINNDTMKVEEIPGSTFSPKPQAPRNVQFETFTEGTGLNTKEVKYQINPDGTRVKVSEGSKFAPRDDGQKPPSGYRFGPNGTLEAIKGGPADKPLKSAPPTVLSAYQGNNQSLAQLDEAIAAVDKAPDEYFGLQGGLGDAYMQRRYPESTDPRGKYFGVAAVKRHDITGAAMSPTEAPDLRPFLPSATDTKAAAKTKLQNLRNEVLKNNSIMEAMYGDTSTYAPLPNVQKAVAPPAQLNVMPKLNTGKINESALKTGVKYDLGNGQSGTWNAKTRTFE